MIVNPHRIHYTCYINNYSQSSILGAYWSTFYTLRIIKITGSCKILQTVLKSYKAHTHYTLYSLELFMEGDYFHYLRGTGTFPLPVL